MKRLAIILCALSTVIIAFGQSYRVKGIIIGQDGETEPYATLKIFEHTDSLKPAILEVAGDEGEFDIKLSSAGEYRLAVSAVGKSSEERDFTLTKAAPTADLGKIMLKEAVTELGEVTVAAQRPLVKKEIDRIGYDVQADPMSKTSPVVDILKKVPLVMVKPDGTILVNGSSDYKIYRNGRPNASYSNNAKELFKSIPASSIKRIEVITDPGAREDAEGVGAILNIVTVEGTQLNGVSGTITAGCNTVEWKPQPLSMFMTTQINKLTVSPYGGFFQGKKMTRSESVSDYTYTDTGDKQRTTASGHGKIHYGYWGFDSSLEFDTLNLFTLEYSGSKMGQSTRSVSETMMTDAEGSPIYSYTASEKVPTFSYINHTAAANYQRSTRHKGETITLSYKFEYSRMNNRSITAYDNLVNFPVGYSAINNRSRSLSTTHTFQVDWTRPFGKVHKLDVGGKYMRRSAESKTDQDYVGLTSQKTDFLHTTDVAAIYADYRASIGRWSLRSGVRYEYSEMGGEFKIGDTPSFKSRFNDIVPNLAVSYNLNESNTLKASYALRINRPGIMTLNPAVISTPSSVSSGNPRLESANSNQLNLNYSLTENKVSVDFTTSYQFSNDGIVQVRDVKDNILYSSYGNVGRTRIFNSSLFVQLTLGDKTSMTLNGDVSYAYFRNPGQMPNTFVRNHGWTAFGFLEFNQELPWDLRASLDLSYWGGGISGSYMTYRPEGWFAFDHTLTIERSFLKDDRLTVSLSASNPFGPRKGCFRQNSINSGMVGTEREKNFYNSFVSMRVSLRFGSLSASVKKAKGISNDDLMSEPSKAGKK